MTTTQHSAVLQFPQRTIPRARRNQPRRGFDVSEGAINIGEERARRRPDPIVYVPMRRSVCIANNIEFLS